MLANVLGVIGVIVLSLIVLGGIVAGVVFGVRHIRSRNQQLKQVVAANAIREQRLSKVYADCRDDELRSSLKDLMNQASFADWAIVTADDARVDEDIARLEHAVRDGDEDSARDLANRIRVALKQREAVVRVERRGSF